MGSEMTDELRELAASYALGTLGAEPAREVAQALAVDPLLAQEVAAFQEVAADLAHAKPLLAPPPALRQRLMASLATPAPAQSAPRLVVRASETGWVKTPFPGVEVKRLFVDPVTGMLTTLLRAAAGSVYPAHQHGGVEQVYVIDGDMVFDDHALDTGDFEVASGATHHSSIKTTEGCLAVIIHSPHDKIFPN
jgi:anti-sigma factor ChrR (cupin superfamily)